jgi:hypothetical protein
VTHARTAIEIPWTEEHGGKIAKYVGKPSAPIAPEKTEPTRSVPIKVETRIASAFKIGGPKTSIRAGPHKVGPVAASAINAPRRRGDRGGATQNMYKLSTVSASQPNFAAGMIVIKRTTNPIIASGTVMTSSSLLRYSIREAAKQAIGTIALTPNVPRKASDQSSVTAPLTTGLASPLAAAKINKAQKKWSRLTPATCHFAIGTVELAGLMNWLSAVVRFKSATSKHGANGVREAS